MNAPPPEEPEELGDSAETQAGVPRGQFRRAGPAPPARPFRIVVYDGCRTLTWGRYSSTAAVDAALVALLHHGFIVRLEKLPGLPPIKSPRLPPRASQREGQVRHAQYK